MPRDFSMSVDDDNGKAVVRVVGEIDLETAPALESRLVELAGSGTRVVTVDMAEIDFIDSTGLHALVVGYRALRALGGDLLVQSPSRNAVRILELSGLDKVVKVV